MIGAEDDHGEVPRMSVGVTRGLRTAAYLAIKERIDGVLQ